MDSAHDFPSFFFFFSRQLGLKPKLNNDKFLQGYLLDLKSGNVPWAMVPKGIEVPVSHLFQSA